MNPILTAIKTHIPAVIIVAALIIGGHSWLQEHDARLQSDMIVQVAQTQVHDLQAQISAVNLAAAQKVQVITKVIHDVKTPTQAVAALPDLTTVPLNARPAVDSPSQISVDAVGITVALGQAKVDKINLDACTTNTTNLQGIIKAREDEVAALKHPKGFWKRVGGTLRTVGVTAVVTVVTTLILVH